MQNSIKVLPTETYLYNTKTGAKTPLPNSEITINTTDIIRHNSDQKFRLEITTKHPDTILCCENCTIEWNE